MQLKSLAKSTEALNKITNTLNNTELSSIAIRETLKTVGKSYTTETLKAAIAQSTLDKQQIKVILSARGLEGELLDTTTAELTQITTTNALSASEKAATGNTLGLSTAFKGLGIKIKETTAAMWAFLTTNPLGWLTLAVSAIAALTIGVKKYNDSIEEAKENARSRTSELSKEFKEMNDTLADHKKLVSELADRYNELSKGVNLSTNRNKSLSTEEYKEFLDINEKLANSFPELAKGIDENGNSILTLGTNGITAKEQLEELLQTEEDLNNFRIAQNLGDAFAGVVTYVNDANEATDSLNSSISDSNEAMVKMQNIAENGIKLSSDFEPIFTANINNQADLAYMNALTKSVDEFWESLDGGRRIELGKSPSDLLVQNFNDATGTYEIYSNLYGLTSEELTTLENTIHDNVGIASGILLDSVSEQSKELQNKVQQGENAWRDFIPNLVAGMKSKQTFKDLDSDLQNFATQIVEGLDYSYATAMKEWNPDDPYAYIRDNLIVPMGNLSDEDKKTVKDSFTELMTLDPEDISNRNQKEIDKLIDDITDSLEIDSIDFRIALGFDVDEAAKNIYNKELEEVKRKLGGYEYDYRGIEVNNAVGDLIDTLSLEDLSIAASLEIPEGTLLSWDELIAKIEEVKAQQSDLDSETEISTISSSIKQMATQLEPQFAKLGEAYKEIFTSDGFTLDAVDNSMLENLRKSFAEIEEEVGVAFDATKLDPFFDALTSDYATSEEGARQVQDAFNELATAYFYSTETLEHLNAETADAIEKQLEEMGVQNAAEIVADALTAKTEELIVAKEYLAETGRELASATEEEQTAFILEQIAAGNCGEALALLQLKKLLVNQSTITTAADCQNLLALAQAANIGTQQLQQLETLMNMITQRDAAADNGDFRLVSDLNHAIHDFSANIINNLKLDDIDIDFGNVGGDSSKNAAKEAGDAYVDAFEEELEELQQLRDDGVITEKEYLDRLRVNTNALYHSNMICKK